MDITIQSSKGPVRFHSVGEPIVEKCQPNKHLARITHLAGTGSRWEYRVDCTCGRQTFHNGYMNAHNAVNTLEDDSYVPLAWRNA